jgi:hypothetical protein
MLPIVIGKADASEREEIPPLERCNTRCPRFDLASPNFDLSLDAYLLHGLH